MKNKLFAFLLLVFLSTFNHQLSTLLAQGAALTYHQGRPGDDRSPAIPFAELGTKVGAEYQGDGLTVLPTPEGASLRCVFQKLEGQATAEGLWLISTADDAKGDRFRVTAMSVGRAGVETTRLTSISDFEFRILDFDSANPSVGSRNVMSTYSLPNTGMVSVAGKLARFVRPGLVEEYSVSVDGVRQDFLVIDRPVGAGELRVELDVAGAKAEALANGAKLVLEASGRKIAYSRLRVVDAQGRELVARMEVASASRLAVVVDDASAAYPVRIDPTFSDADWVSIGGLNHSFEGVIALAILGTDLYAGGDFATAGGIAVNNIARWNGNTWSALGSGLGLGGSASVQALAVLGTNLYAGGSFSTAGGSPANFIAMWNGSTWAALGSGLGGGVGALVVSGTNLYVGGQFTTAGGSQATNIAMWNGSTWSALGAGVERALSQSGRVNALAVSGTNLYVGGYFNRAGGMVANNIARWNGSAWSALAQGTSRGIDFGTAVSVLAVSGTNLYVGGKFISAGFVQTHDVARWNGSAWFALGSGLGVFGIGVNGVTALAVSGTNLYVGGQFVTAGGSPATNIAVWNGIAWSAMGSGVVGASGQERVNALVISGSDLYVGGHFYTAGGKASTNLARAIIAPPALTIAFTNSNTVKVTWPSPSTDFVLQQNTNSVNSANWSNALGTIQDNGTTKTFMVNPPMGNRFYRLFRP